VVEQARTLDRL